MAALSVGALVTAGCSSSTSKTTKTTTTTTTSTSTTTSTTSTTVAAAGVTTTTHPGTSTTAPPTTTAHVPQTVTLTEADNLHDVTLHVGDKLKIVLTGCASCGSQWFMTGQPDPVVFSYDGEQSPPSTTTTTGGAPPTTGNQSVTYTFSFTAVGAHTTGFTAGYFVSGQSTPSQTFSVNLHVVR